jgi:uncharacterized protein YbaR (Trm112 family)
MMPQHHLTWLRCPTCRRPLVPLYVDDGRTVLEPMPHVQVLAAKIVCPVDGQVLLWSSSDRITKPV